MRYLRVVCLLSGSLFLCSCSSNEPEDVAQSEDIAQSAAEDHAVADDAHDQELPSDENREDHTLANQHREPVPQHDKKAHAHGHHADGQHHDGGHDSIKNPHPRAKHHPEKHAHQTAHSDKADKKHAHRSHASRDHKQRPRPRKPNESAAANGDGDMDDTNALAVFNRRILPILKSPNPSSCTQCHLAGVELRNFIHPDQTKTFASLRANGLVDIQNPDQSKILTFISRKPKKDNPISKKKDNPISKRVREQEFQAFRSWIRLAVRNPQLLKAKLDDYQLGIELPAEVIRHARTDRVLSSFVDNIWSQVGRCIRCHSPALNQRVVRKHGEQVSWVVPHDPAGTLKNLVESGNIDLDTPEESPVLTKPAGLSEHGGGPKFLVGGPTYNAFLGFLKDYAAITGGQYKTPGDLPEPNAELIILTEQHLRITGLPEQLDKIPLQVDIFRWNPREKSWSRDRWGTAFNAVNGKKRMWQSQVSVAAPIKSPRAKENRRFHKLFAGRYLIRIYLDREQKKRNDPTYVLSKRELVGQVEIRGEWRPGYQPPKIIDVSGKLKR